MNTLPAFRPHAVAATANLAAELHLLRPALIHFAMRRLRDRSLAEDAVHDALLAVLERPERFAGRSSLLAYVTSILRFKIVDTIREVRRGYHQVAEVNGEGEVNEQAVLHGPAAQSPHGALEQNDFLRLVDRGLRTLPGRAAEAFVLSYGLELSNAEICHEMQISAGNLWTVLHRARTRLRAFVGPAWLGEPHFPRAKKRPRISA